MGNWFVGPELEEKKRGRIKMVNVPLSEKGWPVGHQLEDLPDEQEILELLAKEAYRLKKKLCVGEQIFITERPMWEGTIEHHEPELYKEGGRNYWKYYLGVYPVNYEYDQSSGRITINGKKKTYLKWRKYAESHPYYRAFLDGKLTEELADAALPEPSLNPLAILDVLKEYDNTLSGEKNYPLSEGEWLVEPEEKKKAPHAKIRLQHAIRKASWQEPCPYRFSFINVTLRFKTGPLHANALLVDHHLKTIELFEPHGAWPGNVYWPPPLARYQQTIIQPVKRIMKEQFPGYRFRDISYLCPTLGPQRSDVPRSVKAKRGLCTLWSAMYVHLRLLNHQVRPSKIIEFMNAGGDPEDQKRWFSETKEGKEPHARMSQAIHEGTYNAKWEYVSRYLLWIESELNPEIVIRRKGGKQTSVRFLYDALRRKYKRKKSVGKK
jgi:hypothetical protein